MKSILPVLFTAFTVAGCASSRPTTMVDVDTSAFMRDAALIEQRLER
jgi:hypothetical protein